MGSASSVITAKIGNPVSYAYPNSRVMALRSFMLKEEDVRALSSARNLQEYISLLEHTSYKQDISRISDPTIDRIESALLSNLVSTSRLAMEIAPKNTALFFEEYLGVYEIELIKLVLNRFENVNQQKARDLDYSVYLPVLGAEMKKYAKDAHEAKNKADAIDMLKSTKYGFLAGVPAEDNKSSGQTASLLDKHYYERVWGSMETLPANDSAYARRLIGTEIDAVNILTLLRHAVSGSRAGRFVISAGYRLQDRVSELAGKDTQEILSALSETHYKDLVAEGFKGYEKEKSLIKLELSFKRYVLDEYRRTFKGSPFHIGVLLGFLKSKEYELKNLRAIAVSVDNGLPPKDILDMVIA